MSTILTYFNKQTSPSPEGDIPVDYTSGYFPKINNSSSGIDSEAVNFPESKRPNMLSATIHLYSNSNMHTTYIAVYSAFQTSNYVLFHLV